jgi:hypothetical protein
MQERDRRLSVGWRTKVWGSAYVRSLGAEYLPQLAGSDLRIQTTEMAATAAAVLAWSLPG